MQTESKAFQERQTQYLQQQQQQQWTFQQQLQTQLQGLNAQLQAQQQAFRDYQGSVDNRFYALVHLIDKGASTGSGTSPTTHLPTQPVAVYMQSPPATLSPAFLPTGQATPATASLHSPQFMPPPPGRVQVSVSAQSGTTHASDPVGSLHLFLPPGANSMVGPPGPPPYAHPTQQASSSSTPLNGLVSSPQ
jgi:hypothetical protein